jgi:hypothetical protein
LSRTTRPQAKQTKPKSPKSPNTRRGRKRPRALTVESISQHIQNEQEQEMDIYIDEDVEEKEIAEKVLPESRLRIENELQSGTGSIWKRLRSLF